MKEKLIISFLLFPVLSFAQDKIITKQDQSYDIKIVHVNKEYVFFYPSDDSTKLVRKIPIKTLKDFQYISNTDSSTKKSDSLAYLEYLHRISSEEFNYLENNQPTNIKLTETQQCIKRAGNHLFISAGLVIFSGLMYMLSEERFTVDINDPKYLEKSRDYEKRTRNLRLAAGTSLMAGGLFTVGTAFNIEKASRLLK